MLNIYHPMKWSAVGLADAVGEDEEKVEAVNVRLLILTHTLTIS